MKVLLVRHGNTFAPEDKVVWTGGGNDIPLVARGFEQADALGRKLVALQLQPARIFAGPLQRTATFAERIQGHLDSTSLSQVEIHHCLHEIDYGPWTGLTRTEVIERGDAVDQDAWDTHSIWPSHIFNGSPALIEEHIREFVNMLYQRYPRDLLVCVSSNGILRYFLKLIEGAFEEAIQQQDFKVKTGHCCFIEFRGGVWKKHFWNLPPEMIDRQYFSSES